MAATGNITEDLEAIRQLVRPGTFSFDVYERDGLFPWSLPATEEEIDAASARLPGLPDEVIEIFRVSANVVAGGLNFKRGLDGMTVYDREFYISATGFGFGFKPSDELDANRTVEDDDGWVPNDGDLVFLGSNLAMPTTGPHSGVVYWGGASSRLAPE